MFVRYAVDPVVTLVRDTVIPETGRLVDQARDVNEPSRSCAVPGEGPFLENFAKVH